MINLGANKVEWLITFLDKRSTIIVAVIVVIVILSGIIYSLYLGDVLRFLPDEKDYYDLATNITTKGIFSLDGETSTAYRPPGYPLFLSVFRFLGGGVIYIRILNFLIFGLGIILVFKILLEEHSPLAGLIGVLLVIGYPVIFFTAGTIYPQILASVLLLLIIFFYTRNPSRVWIYILCGVLFGYLIVTVPTFVLALLLFPIWLGPEGKQSKGYLVMLVVALSLVGLWMIRNYAVFGDYVFVSTNSGENLLLGNSEHTTPNGGRTINISRYTSEAATLSEVERDKFYRSRAVEYIRNNKLQTVRMYLLKVLNYFNFKNKLVTKSEGSQLSDAVMLLTYGLLISLFLIRLLMGRILKFSHFEKMLIVLYFAGAFFSAIFFTRIRFRIPYDFLLIIIVALFLAELSQKLIAHRGSHIDNMSKTL